MTVLLDLATVAAIGAALVFLLRPRRKVDCAGCEPPEGASAQTRIPVEWLRASARRASGRR